jgi:hypothetical protein
MAVVRPDINDLFEQLKQDASAVVGYGDILVSASANGTSRRARIGVNVCAQRISATLQEIERIFSLISVPRLDRPG